MAGLFLRTKSVQALRAVLLLALSAFPVNLAAQHRLRLGARLGVSGASLHGDAVEDVNTREGITGGLFATLNVTPRLAIQPGLLYAQKGGRLTGSAYDFINYELDYVEIPVLIKYALLSRGSVRPSLLAGGAIAFLDRGRWRAQWTSPNPQPRAFVVSPRDRDVGLIFGAQVTRTSGRHELLVDGRYTIGLRSIDSSSPPVEEKLRTLSVTVGWSLGFIRR